MSIYCKFYFQEAESQCAYLDVCNLTMGTITDDSDVLLFGGRVVYKGIFDKKRDPSMFSACDIKAELGLERNHLVNIALCSGSDYTIGWFMPARVCITKLYRLKTNFLTFHLRVILFFNLEKAMY